MRYVFTLTGTTPLLMHADDVEKSEVLMGWRKNPKNREVSRPGDDRSPAWTWHTYLYNDGQNIAMPSDNIQVALRQAGAKMPSGKGKGTLKAKSQTALLFPDEFCTFLVKGQEVSVESIDQLKELEFGEQADAARKLGFRLFLKRAKIGQAKHIRVRPRFDTWEVKGIVEVVNTGGRDEITSEQLLEMFTIAGTSSGLCDWRPSSKQSPGPFGQFSVSLKKA